ncbi:MAG: ribose 5-phosphate isomerase B [Clostridia bacterium]
MSIVIGSDHGGFNLKETIKAHLTAKGYDVLDVGTHDTSSCDYPNIAKEACDKIIDGTCENGILVCGTGIGISIAANKVKGIRAAACQDFFAAKYTRLHNNANVLCLGERITGVGTALEMVDVFLDTEFEQGGRHQTRIDLISKIENI